MSNLLYHKEITDAQWNRIKFLFPKKKVGRPPLDPGIVFNAILWMLSECVLCAEEPSNVTGGNVHDSETAIEFFANVDIEGKNSLLTNQHSR